MKSLFNAAIPYFVALFFLLAAVKSWQLYYKEKQTTNRLTENLKVIQKDAEYFKAKNSDQAIKIQSQELTIQELRKISPAIIQDLKNLYIAPRHLVSYQQAVTSSKETILTTLRDSIIFDTIKVKRIDYFDKWFSVEGMIIDDSLKMDINSRDTITIVNYLSRRPHPLLWIFGGRRYPEAIISNKNPYNKITIEKSIAVKK